MSQATRRARVHAVRVRQTRIAAITLAQASHTLARLEDTAQHLTQMAHSLARPMGPAPGASLREAGELAARLRKAVHDLEHPIARARTDREDRLAQRVQAEWRENGASRLADDAQRRDAREKEARLAADRPHRLPISLLEKSV